MCDSTTRRSRSGCIRGLLAVCMLVHAGQLAAEPLTIAVASNFATPARRIADEFAAASGQSVQMVSGSTGKLYAQIVNGAPFDVLLAADAARPLKLEAEGLGVAGSRFSYATGALVLWSADKRLAGADCRLALRDAGDWKLAIANPATAPYGAAAEQFLRSEQLWDSLQQRLVIGENIAQALQFVATGNARLGLIAASQEVGSRLPEPACRWPVPASTHAPIEQQAILLRDAPSPEAARAFLDYLHADAARAVIRSYGYSAGQ